MEDVVIDGTEYSVLTRPLSGGGAVMVAQSYEGAARVDDAFLWRVTGTTATALALSALLSWFVLGRILRPVRNLARTTARITATRDLSTDLPPAGSDEVGQLTRSFAAMLTALRRSRDQQHRLVQDASHELRTPLTSVRGSAELLQRGRGRLAPEDEKQILTTLVTETAALDDLVRELVELATDRYTDEAPATVDLTILAEDTALCHRAGTGRTITVTAAKSIPVRARPRALQRCVDNLISNAVKFSPQDSPVVLHVEGCRRSVRDRGPGIEPAERDAVFARFYRGSRTQAAPGAGLGLAIVHDSITADGGTVFVTDTDKVGTMSVRSRPAAAALCSRSSRTAAYLPAVSCASNPVSGVLTQPRHTPGSLREQAAMPKPGLSLSLAWAYAPRCHLPRRSQTVRNEISAGTLNSEGAHSGCGERPLLCQASVRRRVGGRPGRYG
ncbi:ATP-binding protein [Streptomyces sp. NPDC094466]|uniref:HAMP domain-containing sensor histidine kinase n=1 Tax=Streptomyces sp. NPDC094466 TaxID=3366065 RepID=UPI00380499E3